MKNIAFIPLRAGSKGIPNKNIIPLNGKPLVNWVLKSLAKVKELDKIYVSTDGKEIAKTVKKLKIKNLEVISRSEKVSTDTASTESTLLEFIQVQNIPEDATLLLVQATNPFTTSKQFKEALNNYDLFQKRFPTGSMISLAKDPSFLWNISNPYGIHAVNYSYKQRPRRQDFQQRYALENGAFYINKVRNILSTKNRLSEPIKPYLMPVYTKYEIDHPEEIKLVELLLETYKNED